MISNISTWGWKSFFKEGLCDGYKDESEEIKYCPNDFQKP
jgi:hypothetical protein